MKGLNPLKRLVKNTLQRVRSQFTPITIISLHELASHHFQKHVITPTEQISFADDNDDACDYLQYQSYAPHDNCTVTRRETYTATLQNVLFAMRTGLVQLDAGVILESGVDQARIETVYEYPLGKPERLDGAYTSVWGQFTHNYGHWMIECLLRLYSVHVGVPKPVTLLMPDDLTPVQQASFDACVPDGVQVRYMPRKTHLNLETFTFVSHATSGTSFYFPPRPHLDYVRERIFKHYQIAPDANPQQRIYIRRGKANYRYVINEDAVIAALETRGFQAYYLEELTFEQQVRLFNSAEIVVSPHSSGLINLMFAPSSTTVIEISSHAPEPSFFFVAKAMQQRYGMLFAQEIGDQRNFPQRATDPTTLRELINKNLTIDTQALLQKIDDFAT